MARGGSHHTQKRSQKSLTINSSSLCYKNVIKSVYKIYIFIRFDANIKYINILEINYIKYFQQIYIHLWYESEPHEGVI